MSAKFFEASKNFFWDFENLGGKDLFSPPLSSMRSSIRILLSMAPALSTSFLATPADVVDDDIIGYSCKMISDVAQMYHRRCHKRRRGSRWSRSGRKARPRNRLSVVDQYLAMGPQYFRRAYRMEYESFWKLHELLEEGIEWARLNQRGYEAKGGREGGMYLPPPTPNGKIESSVRLACALRYFAGGSPYDIMGKYHIAYSEVLASVWYVVEAVNELQMFDIKYPESAEEQRKIAREFQAVSSANFNICAGAIDGILIWIKKPTIANAERAGSGQMRFLCGRKGKFGLNCQAVSDVRGRFLDISIGYGGSSSDCLAFEASSLYHRCEHEGLMKDGLVLFGDNAYLNTQYMATPYTNVAGNEAQRTKDDYNFYHSQLRIRIECAFGMLVQRWGILRTAIPHTISLTRIVGLVNTLARLHNFCIDEADRLNNKEQLVNRLSVDVQHMVENEDGYVELRSSREHRTAIPTALLNAFEPFDGVSDNLLRQHRYSNPENMLPRYMLHQLIADNHYSRPIANRRRDND